MLRYALIRLVQSAITLIGVSIIVFCFARLSGYTPSFLLCDNGGCDEYNQKHASAYHFLGFNDPWYIHYFTFVKNASRGEFGPSSKWQGRTAMELVPLHFPASLQLAVVSIGATLLLAVPIGVISAVKKGSVLDAIGRGVARFGQSIPPFWLGIVLVLIFYVHLGWLPSSGRGGVANLVLPSIALGLFTVAAVMRLTRTSMLDALDSNYIKMVRIRGIPEWRVVWKHGLANAAIPVLAAFPFLAALYMVNTVAIETVFTWPGVGLLALQAVIARDFQVVQAMTMLIAVLFIGINLLIDILCAYIDPRIRQA